MESLGELVYNQIMDRVLLQKYRGCFARPSELEGRLARPNIRALIRDVSNLGTR
jgi:hypothetical protein